MIVYDEADNGLSKLDSIFKQLKVKKEVIKMSDIKSRYEVISDLEEKKRNLIMERDSFSDKLEVKEQALIESQRELEDQVRALRKYKESIEQRKATIQELIVSIDDSLKRLGNLDNKKKS